MANKNIIKQFIFSSKIKSFLISTRSSRPKTSLTVFHGSVQHIILRLTISLHLNDNSQQINQNWFVVTLKKQFLIKAM